MPLPITRDQAHKVAEWMKGNFGAPIKAAVSGTPFSPDIVCAIACQETAFVWVHFIDSLSVDEIIARCVFDASGDFPGTHRSAFPRDTAAFRARYGDEFTEMLIDEANKTRALRGYKPAQWVYKGYGIYQYDLQNVSRNEAFFREKQWYSHDRCLEMLMAELNEKYAAQRDLWKAIKAYNGSGASATAYANNVIQFAHYCAEVDG